MSGPENVGGAEVVTLSDSLRRELLRLAKTEEDIAADEAATVPYWAPSPASILGHRIAASVLRTFADQVSAPYAPVTT
jgi:hypothetical protein